MRVSPSTSGSLRLHGATSVVAHHLQRFLLFLSVSCSPFNIKNSIWFLIPSTGKHVETRGLSPTAGEDATLLKPLWKAIPQTSVKLKGLIYRPGTNPTETPQKGGGRHVQDGLP